MMKGSEVFDAHSERYECWFAQYPAAYRSELRAMKSLLKRPGLGLEIGVGTGQFAAPLNVPFGIDPAPNMLRYAMERGTNVVCAVGESLPFGGGVFDSVTLVTTLGFVGDPGAVLAEAHRVLKPEGVVVIGFIDRSSALGQQYQGRKHDSIFYRQARFFCADDIEGLLTAAGFGEHAWVQTLTKPLAEITEVEAERPGHGDGVFVAVRAERSIHGG